MGTTWRRGVLAAAALLAGASHMAAQVRGRVEGGGDAAPVAGARVRLLGAEGILAQVESDAHGRFVLPSLAGPARVVAAAIGFRPETLAVAPGTRTLALRLEAARVTLAAVTVTAAPQPGAVTRRSVDRLEIDRRRPASVQDVLRLTPGLLVVQHAGGGKAEQLFLRGFDADHGTDIALAVDGTPVNLVSHAHGQGYADLHFLLPEVVERLEVRKGPFDPSDGDFATAGAVSFVTRDRVPAPAVETRGGSFGTARVVGLLPVGRDGSDAGGFVALAAQRTAGPFEADQRFRRFNGFGKWTAPIGKAALVAAASGYDARWHGSGPIPARAVAAGALSRFGAIDSTEGGDTRRVELSLALRPRYADEAWGVRAYAVGSRLRLFSNFTFFARDSLEGDGIEQVDDRLLVGIDGRALVSTPLGQADLGAGLRSDHADVGLFDQTHRRRRGTRLRSDVSQQHVFLWSRRTVRLGENARLDLGGRADLFRFAVRDRTGGAGPAGERWLGRVSPRIAAAVELDEGTTLHAGVGLGFHSNDARDVVSAGPGEPVLPRATSAEAGIRRRWGGGEVAMAVWGLDLASELVFVGDEGVTEPSGPTRRLGIDLEGRVRLTRWLWADADLSLARARVREAAPGANRVPLAPWLSASGGLTVRDAGPVEAWLRARLVGSRPADETNTLRATGSTVLDTGAAWRTGRLELRLAVENLLDVEWNEAQFAATSRLRGEAAPVTEIHFTPGARRGVALGVSYGL